MAGYGWMIEGVIKTYLIEESKALNTKKEDLRIVINPRGEELSLLLYKKAELIKSIQIEEIIGE